MKVKIWKGTNQIGGCITEIKTEHANIIIDFGSDLDEEKDFEIEGLTKGTPAYDAVFITHSHGDHIGLIHNILDTIPIYVEEISEKIYHLLNAFTYKKHTQKQTLHFNFHEPITIKDITITPFLVDHSSYNAAMFLIETENKRILHTGDFRNHGRKGPLFLKTLEEIGKVDLIITEGTTLGRKNEKSKTEEELTLEATEIFKKYDQVFILQASTNIDRITTIYKASRKTNKNFIEDLFTANIATHLQNNKIPNPQNFSNVYVWIPKKYQKKKNEFKKLYIEPFKKYSKKEAYENKKYTLLVKTSMLDDIEKLYAKKKITNAVLLYSMWAGYQEKEEMKEFLGKIKNYGIYDKINLHTSGHANQETIALLNKLKAKKVIPIHTTNAQELQQILENVYLIKDEEEIEV